MSCGIFSGDHLVDSAGDKAIKLSAAGDIYGEVDNTLLKKWRVRNSFLPIRWNYRPRRRESAETFAEVTH